MNNLLCRTRSTLCGPAQLRPSCYSSCMLQVSCTFPDAHARPVQRLVQPAASPFVSHARQIHELFASAAPDGVIKLWDVRSGSCVRSFTGHKHSSSQVCLVVGLVSCDTMACAYMAQSSTSYSLRQARSQEGLQSCCGMPQLYLVHAVG